MMYKILHLATGTYVMGNPGMDACFRHSIEINTRVFEANAVVFVKTRGRISHYAEIAYMLNVNNPDSITGNRNGNDIIPKHQFEIVEVPDV